MLGHLDTNSLQLVLDGNEPRVTGLGAVRGGCRLRSMPSDISLSNGSVEADIANNNTGAIKFKGEGNTQQAGPRSWQCIIAP